MKRKHLKTIKLIYSRPVSGNVPWVDIESLFKALGADISKRAGSRSLSENSDRREGKQELGSFCPRLRRIVVLFNAIEGEKWLISAFPQ